MYKIDQSDNVAAKPAPSALGTPGWFRKAVAATSTRGTVVTADWANIVQEELISVVLADTVLFPAGLDKTDGDQVIGVLAGALAMRSGATDSGTTAAMRQRAAIACSAGTGTVAKATGAGAVAIACANSSLASGAQSVVAASHGSVASGIASAVVACNDDGGSGGHASGEGSFCAACDSSGVSGDNSTAQASVGTTAAGDRTAVIATSGTCSTHASATDCILSASAGGSNIGANAARAACIATNNCDVGATSNAYNSAIVGALDSEVDALRSFLGGVNNGAISAGTEQGQLGAKDCTISGGSQCGMAGVDSCTVSGGSGQHFIGGSEDSTVSSGQHTGIVGCDDAEINGGTDCALVGCGKNATAGGPESAANQSAMLGCAGPFDSSGGQAQVLAACRCSATCTVDSSRFMWAGSDFAALGTIPTRVDGIGGGNGSGVQWRIDSAAGDFWYEGALQGSGADYAEYFENHEDCAIPVGTILVRDKRGVRCARAGDRVLGAVATHPAICGNCGGENSGRDKQPESWTPTALLGQLPVLVDETVRPDCFVIPGSNGVGTAHPKPGAGRTIECIEIIAPGVALCLVG